jgi:hypothetical protein
VPAPIAAPSGAFVEFANSTRVLSTSLGNKIEIAESGNPADRSCAVTECALASVVAIPFTECAICFSSRRGMEILPILRQPAESARQGNEARKDRAKAHAKFRRGAGNVGQVTFSQAIVTLATVSAPAR